MNARAASRILIALIVIVLIVLGLSVTGVTKKFIGGASTGNEAAWQAVFLNNGQVYFGKITSDTGKEIILQDIYYLQVDQTLQPNQNQNQAQPSKLSLVKLGNELHGPKDRMRINRDQATFIEDLKDDGKVVTAINDFIKNGSQPTTPATTNPSPTTTK